VVSSTSNVEVVDDDVVDDDHEEDDVLDDLAVVDVGEDVAVTKDVVVTGA
jgi:hypothetical protein